MSYPDYINPNKYAGTPVPSHNPSPAPSAFTQWMWENGDSMASLFNPILGAGMSVAGNVLSQMYQNRTQERFYNEYQSPEARMAQMKAAGINPNAAAQGISGAAAPGMTAASPTNAFNSLGELVGNSYNSMLSARVLKSEADRNNAETELTKSLNVEKQTTNKYVDAMQNAALRKLVNDGDISRHQANMMAVDDYYHGAEAYAHLEQSFLAVQKIGAECQNLQQEYFNLLAEEYATMMQGNLAQAQIRKVFSDIGLNNAMIDKIAHECENIDASTALMTQEVSESKSRERLNRALAQYQEKANVVWESSGWNTNSDVNGNFMRLCMEGKTDEAKRLLLGVKAMVYQEGDARFGSKDYMFDKSMDMIGNMTRLLGFGMIGSGLHSHQPVDNVLLNPYGNEGRSLLDKAYPYVHK